MKYKNYYKILGLSSSKASDDEIKSAYRHLAKIYHPDLNGGDPIIEEKFKDINEAYQVLGDNISRKKYDRVHFAYKFRDGISGAQLKDKINVSSGVSEFFTTFFGSKNNEPHIVTNLDKYKDENNKAVDGKNLESDIEISLEEAFFGSERKIAFRESENTIKTIRVKIPRGIQSGEKIRLANQGRPGKNGGKDGDFFIRVNILPDSRYEVCGRDIMMDLKITPWEAALGADFYVDTIDSKVFVSVPAGTQSGEKIRIVNKGYVNKDGRRGDLILSIKIMIPEKLTTEEKELFLKLKEISAYTPRKSWHLHNYLI